MSRFLVCSILLWCCVLGLGPTGCVKQDPVDTLIIQKVQEELTANYDPAIMTKTLKWDMLKDNMKIWLVEEFEAEKVKEFAEAAAKAFGTIGRTNGKVTSDYVVQLYQKQTNKTSGKTQEYNIAKATFHNGKETVDVDLYGQGDGKYDY